MPRRKRTLEEIARKERTKALMKELDIKDMDDIQDLFKSFVAAALEGGLFDNVKADGIKFRPLK